MERRHKKVNRLPKKDIKPGTQLLVELPLDANIDELNASVFFIVPMEPPYGKVTMLITPKRVIDLKPFMISLQ